jgi:hypothetical protein
MSALRPAHRGALGLGVACLLVACATRSLPPDPGPGAPAPARVPPVSATRVERIAQPNTLGVVQGSNCGQSAPSGPQSIVEMEGSQSLPAFATTGTVLLNGWKLRYLSDDDHHVTVLHASIQEVRIEGGVLRWVARGQLADEDYALAIEFCYWYLVLVWNQALIDASTDNGNVRGGGGTALLGNLDPNPAFQGFGRAHHPGHASTYVRIPAARGKRTIAILPRGFSLQVPGHCIAFPCITSIGGGWSSGPDIHVLQLGYALGQTERMRTAGTYSWEGDQFLLYPGPIRVEDDLVSWRSSGILKDNDARTTSGLWETTTALFGDDVDVVQPPFAAPVRDDEGPFGSEIGGLGVQTREETVENIPFQYAIPMLTGWELRFPREDRHVSEVGVWIHDIRHSGVPATLQYKLSWILRDKDDLPSGMVSHRVNILGLQAR